VENCNKNSKFKKTSDSSFEVITEPRNGRSKSSNLSGKASELSDDLETTVSAESVKKLKSLSVKVSSCLDTSIDQSIQSDFKPRKSKDTSKRMEKNADGNTMLDQSIDSDRKTRRSDSRTKRDIAVVKNIDFDALDKSINSDLKIKSTELIDSSVERDAALDLSVDSNVKDRSVPKTTNQRSELILLSRASKSIFLTTAMSLLVLESDLLVLRSESIL
jgi:ribosomal protein S26